MFTRDRSGVTSFLGDQYVVPMCQVSVAGEGWWWSGMVPLLACDGGSGVWYHSWPVHGDKVWYGTTTGL